LLRGFFFGFSNFPSGFSASFSAKINIFNFQFDQESMTIRKLSTYKILDMDGPANTLPCLACTHLPVFGLKPFLPIPSFFSTHPNSVTLCFTISLRSGPKRTGGIWILRSGIGRGPSPYPSIPYRLSFPVFVPSPVPWPLYTKDTNGQFIWYITCNILELSLRQKQLSYS
jgi:hypothetical protein